MYFNNEDNYFKILNNDYNFENNIFNNFNIEKVSSNNKLLADDDDGFNKGNIFNNLYSKYKNHVYKLKVYGERDKLLYKVQMYQFILKDLTLYLDIHTNDKQMINEYKKYQRLFNNVKNEYEKKYGPLCSMNEDNDNVWDYVKNPWPWDKGDN